MLDLDHSLVPARLESGQLAQGPRRGKPALDHGGIHPALIRIGARPPWIKPSFARTSRPSTSCRRRRHPPRLARRRERRERALAGAAHPPLRDPDGLQPAVDAAAAPGQRSAPRRAARSARSSAATGSSRASARRPSPRASGASRAGSSTAWIGTRPSPSAASSGRTPSSTPRAGGPRSSSPIPRPTTSAARSTATGASARDDVRLPGFASRRRVSRLALCPDDGGTPRPPKSPGRSPECATTASSPPACSAACSS